MNSERLYKSRLIVGDSIILWRKKMWSRPETQIYIHPVCRHHRSRDNLTKIDCADTHPKLIIIEHHTVVKVYNLQCHRMQNE